MRKSTFTPHYEALRKRIAQLRRQAGLTQRQLARKLGRDQQFVTRMERGERRIDLVEFYWLCGALGADPREEALRFVNTFRRLDRRDRGRPGA